MATSHHSYDPGEERIVHVREALMCSNNGGAPSLRTARFLNHGVSSIDDDIFDLPSDAFSSQPETFNPEKWPLRFSLVGWGSPSLDWVMWVNSMAESYAPLWRKSRIYEAIMASRYEIKKQEDLILGLVEKWSTETNTFLFPWGEATMTLEDMMILGGFSAVGNYVLGSIKRDELKLVEENLKRAKHEICKNSGKKCLIGLWMKEFMNSDSEIEHEAFIATWLARFVFPNSAGVIMEKLFPAAVHLASGIRLALSPAVLAGIYKDLGLLKEKIKGYVHSAKVEEETLVLTSPLQFVQVWAWERITAVRPSPKAVPSPLKPGDPRIARWQHRSGLEYYSHVQDFRKVLDSALESFVHRPYSKPLKNYKLPKFYMERDCRVSVDPSLDEEIVSFARFLRFSKLVGVNCIEPYYPHRVAMQFGYDQDLPGIVQARAETPESAWKDYIRPICDEILFVPSRRYEADVTYSYSCWWKESVSILQSNRSTHKDSPQKEKQKLVQVPSSPGKLKKAAGKVDGQDQERKGGVVSTNSRIAVKRMKSTGRNIVAGSNEVAKQAKGEEEGGSLTGGGKMLIKKSEIAKSPARSIKSTDESKKLRGAVKGSREEKFTGENHVKFLLPSSSNKSSKTPALSPKPNKKISPVKSPKPLPRTPAKNGEEKGKRVQPSLVRRDLRKTPVHSAAKVKNDSSKVSSNPGSSSSEIKTTKQRRVVKRNEIHSVPPGSDNAGAGADEMSEEQKSVTEESMKDIQVAKENVVEEGEILHQISKSQFEALNQGFHDVLMELQTIRSALKISKK